MYFLKENILAGVIGVVLAFLVVFAINNNNFLLGDINKGVVNATFDDFVIDKGNDSLSLVSNKEINGIQIVFVRLKGNVNPKELKSSFDYLIEQMDGYTNIMFMVKALSKGEKIFTVSNSNIKLESIKIMFTDGKLDEFLFK